MDHSEEAELKKCKSNIVKEIRQNQLLEKEMNEMDIKIGVCGVCGVWGVWGVAGCVVCGAVWRIGYSNSVRRY